MMLLGRLMRSAMVLISLKAFSMARSELLRAVRRFWYFELPDSSKPAAPVGCGGREQARMWLQQEHARASSSLYINLNRLACQKQTSKHPVAVVTVNRVHGDCCHSNLPPCLS